MTLVSVSRQLQDVAPQGGGLIAATILFLSLAWSGIDPQGAEAVFDIPYQVRFVWHLPRLLQLPCLVSVTDCVCVCVCVCLTPFETHVYTREWMHVRSPCAVLPNRGMQHGKDSL